MKPPKGRDGRVGFFADLADRAHDKNRGLPKPIKEGGGAELELQPPEDGASDEGEGAILEMEDTLTRFDGELSLNGLPGESQQGESHLKQKGRDFFS